MYGSEDDIIVKESITRTGRTLYIVTSLNGAEPVVKKEIAAASGSCAYCLTIREHDIWLHTQAMKKIAENGGKRRDDLKH